MAKKKTTNAADAVRSSSTPRYGKSPARVKADRKIVKRYEDGSHVLADGSVWDPEEKRYRRPRSKTVKPPTSRHYGSA